MTDESYDPVLFIHWLYWELRRLKGSAEDYERLFQDVSARARDRFVRIRPYGHFGDRKVDGLYWDEGTAYQVYSPDEMKESDTRRKITEDLQGAVTHWAQQLKHWVFVYNVRRGVAPDVIRLLNEQRSKYPGITISPMSNDDLWKIAGGLPAQARVELLGPPPDLADILQLGPILPQEIQDRLEHGRFVVVHDVLSPVNIRDAIRAIHPAGPFGPPLFVRPSVSTESWTDAANLQKAVIDDALARSRARLPRFAVFSLAPIPLAIHLGFLLSDRIEVEPFQFHRDRKSWAWPVPAQCGDLGIEIRGMPAARIGATTAISVRVCLSAEIGSEEVRAVTGVLPVEVELRVRRPDVEWLVSPGQLQVLGRTFRSTVAELRRLVPNADQLHLFYAGPTGGAVVVGQSINPKMNPPVALYEYNRQRQPRYERVLTLSE
jgi:hypothetical protein